MTNQEIEVLQLCFIKVSRELINIMNRDYEKADELSKEIQSMLNSLKQPEKLEPDLNQQSQLKQVPYVPELPRYICGGTD